MRKILVIFINLMLFCVFFSGCAPKQRGETLNAFVNRMNAAEENYLMTSKGFIFDETESTLSRFYKFGEKEMLLSFTKNDENNLKEMNLVFPRELSSEQYSLDFIRNCIISFIDDENKCNELLKEINFEKIINTDFLKTVSAEYDDISIFIDTTELGTVITVYKDI